jgi:hypothetical protein
MVKIDKQCGSGQGSNGPLASPHLELLALQRRQLW